MLSHAESLALHCRLMGRALLNSFAPVDEPCLVMWFYLLGPWMKPLRVTQFKQKLFTVMLFGPQNLVFETKRRILFSLNILRLKTAANCFHDQ